MSGVRPVRRLTGARALVAALGALVLCGCPPKPPAVRPYPPPTTGELAAALAARHAAVRSMNARVRATSWLGGDRVRATVLMLVTRAGQLRFEAEVSLQGTVATLVTDGVRFALLDVHRNELRQGPACPANVASLIRIPLGPAEVAAILLGDVALDPAATAPGQASDEVADDVTWDAERGADVWTVRSADGVMQLAFQGTGGDRKLVGVARDRADGERLWRTAYEDFAPVEAGGGPPGGSRPPLSLPSVIRFAEGRSSFDDGVEIRFKDRTLNVSPRPDDFVLRAPPGVTVREVGCGGGG